MEAGQQGPVHRFDTEQAWHLTEGRAEIAADGTAIALGPGDSVVVPAGVTRQVTALTRVRFVVCGDGRGVAWVPGEDQSRGTPPWIG
jgi:quercetin dioxygenase-like cupin family protein